MKRSLLTILVSALFINHSYAVGLMDVYNDALQNDETYKQAEYTFLQTKEVLPQARAALLPQITASTNAGQLGQSWTNPASYHTNLPYKYGSTGYNLTITQTLFNWNQFATYEAANAQVAQAGATFTYAQQNLALRVAQAYFNVLQAQEILLYTNAQKVALASSLEVSKQRYEVGLDPITNVYAAQASYDGAVAQYIAAQNQVAVANENLRVLTNKIYPSLNSLQYDFPLVAPNPENIDAWTAAGIENNLQLKSDRYAVLAAQDNLHAAEGNRLPTASLVGSYGTQENNANLGSVAPTLPGNNSTATLSAVLNFNAYTGGNTSSVIRQNEAAYQLANATMELQYRQTVASTRTDYLNVVSGISQVQADRQEITANLSALASTQAGYKVGTQTINDVLQQQTFLYNAQKAYVNDRFSYLLSTLSLKQDTGSLGPQDLAAIDKWLSANSQSTLTQPINSIASSAATTTSAAASVPAAKKATAKKAAKKKKAKTKQTATNSAVN